MGNRTKEQLKKHYKEYQGTPEQIKKRSQRVMARRAAEKAGLVHKGDGKDKGGSNARSNLRVVSKAKNRGYKRDSKNNPI
jgi:hypothetical protein